MSLRITEESSSSLRGYASIPIAFEVSTILELTIAGHGLGGFIFTERTIDTPYVKDYDALDGEGPLSWSERFDLSNWGFLAAWSDDTRVGGAAIAFDTHGIDMLEGRNDLAVLWDLRVAPSARGIGAGSALFRAAGEWAMGKGCRHLKVETQNINLSACRFYARQGCTLGAIDRFAYPTLPDEIQLIWYKELV